MRKRLLVPTRVRRVPSQFSWVDQRLVRDRHILRCDPDALALYLFLVTVADAQGVSFYGDRSIERLVSLPSPRLAKARARLVNAGLLAYEAPLYQVLALEPPASPPSTPAPPTRASGEPRSLRTLLDEVLKRHD
ncbi:MAG: hypothetical protein PVF91_15015 [Chromatiales bacterium]